MLLVASPVKGFLPLGPLNVPWVLVLYSLVTITQNVLGENSTTTTVHVAANFLVGTWARCKVFSSYERKKTETEIVIEVEENRSFTRLTWAFHALISPHGLHLLGEVRSLYFSTGSPDTNPRVRISRYGSPGTDSRVWIPGMDCWVWIPGYVFPGTDPRVRIPGYGCRVRIPGYGSPGTDPQLYIYIIRLPEKPVATAYSCVCIHRYTCYVYICTGMVCIRVSNSNSKIPF